MRWGALAGVLLCTHLTEARAEAPDSGTPVASTSQRRGILTVRGAWRTGVPDYLGGSLTVNAIPWVDVELGVTLVNPVLGSLYLRAGPRWSLYEGRNDAGRGLSLRLSALAGARNTSTYSVSQGDWGAQWGLNAVGALEGTYWLARYFGVSAQLVAGGTAYFPLRRPVQVLSGPVTPDARFSLGLSF
ncbi:hypothetical protein [Archangium lansingense]|uniref:DUF3575 domain-containing protein n=1 Tax=Archangium lansingense TaxID=2995310 RepID=A0ABT4A3E8_9BACT|nr:hypothetical protein [Archangium lansinium]MCY1076118.1 hypothetical protein [Archangium lansinium]